MVKSYYSGSNRFDRMLFQCGRLEGLLLAYVSLVGATSVGRIGTGFSRFIGGYTRQLNDGRNLMMERNRSRHPSIECCFLAIKLFSALLLISLDLDAEITTPGKDEKMVDTIFSSNLVCTIQILPLPPRC